MYTAFFDTCVLYSSNLRDVLLSCATDRYAVRWSPHVLAALRRELAEVTHADLDWLFDQMATHFPEASVTGYEGLIDSMTNHARDRHVLAAAIVSGADVLVTDNVRHFPAESYAEQDLMVQTADAFLADQFHGHPELCIRNLEIMCARRQRKPNTIESVLEKLSRLSPPASAFIAAVRNRRHA